MIFDCLILKSKFIVARPHGWNWSQKERAEFDLIVTNNLEPATEDYQVDLGVCTVMASRISPSLVIQETP